MIKALHNGAGVGYSLSNGLVHLFSSSQSFAKENNKSEKERERELALVAAVCFCTSAVFLK
jgi:hypothetical protein